MGLRVAQVGLESLDSSDPPSSTSQVARTTGEHPPVCLEFKSHYFSFPRRSTFSVLFAVLLQSYVGALYSFKQSVKFKIWFLVLQRQMGVTYLFVFAVLGIELRALC